MGGEIKQVGSFLWEVRRRILNKKCFQAVCNNGCKYDLRLARNYYAITGSGVKAEGYKLSKLYFKYLSFSRTGGFKLLDGIEV